MSKTNFYKTVAKSICSALLMGGIVYMGSATYAASVSLNAPVTGQGSSTVHEQLVEVPVTIRDASHLIEPLHSSAESAGSSHLLIGMLLILIGLSVHGLFFLRHEQPMSVASVPDESERDHILYLERKTWFDGGGPC